MEIKKIKFGAILLVFLLLVASVFASPPPIPDKFSGDVKINDDDAPIGTTIEVYVNGELEEETSTTAIGEYDLYVKTGDTGDEITFKILNQAAGTSVREGGKTETLDLAVNVEDNDEVDDTDDSSSDENQGGSSSRSRSNSDSGYVPDFVPFEEEEDSSETMETDDLTGGVSVLKSDGTTLVQGNKESNEEESNALWNMLTGAVIGNSGEVKNSVLFSVVFLGLLVVVLTGLMYWKFKKK